MIIPLEFYNQLRQQLKVSSIVRQKVSLQKKGREYIGICPFHTEKTPSFTVNDAKGFYHCFGCSAHGDVIKFVSETTGLTFKEAAIKIAEENGIEVPKISHAQEKEYEEAQQIYNTLELAAEYFCNNFTDQVQQYLIKRGIDKPTQKKFSIGYAPGKGHLIKFFEKKSISLQILLNSGLVGKKEDGKIYEVFTERVIFPIRNVYNKVVGFGGRVLTDSLPKYINSPETLVFKKNETMYGENIAISAAYKKNYSILVEGYMDVIALNQAGIKEVVGSLGTAVTEKHLQKLWRSAGEIIVCLDGDSAGQRASKKLINTALPMLSSDKKISFIHLPNSKDPDDIIKSGGTKLFNELLTERVDLSEAIWQNEYKGKGFSSAEAKADLERSLENYCIQIKDRILATSFRKYFKDQIWQNLYRNNAKIKASKSLINSTNKTYINAQNKKNYTEIEVVELAICSFMVKFPNILQNSCIKNSLSEISFSYETLGEFKEWFINLIDNHDLLSNAKLLELMEKTEFYDIFLFLSDSQETFLDVTFVNNNQDNYELIFNLLSKKLYLLLLKQEYTNVISSINEDSQVRASFYLQEIQETSKILNELNEFFINN